MQMFCRPTSSLHLLCVPQGPPLRFPASRSVRRTPSCSELTTFHDGTCEPSAALISLKQLRLAFELSCWLAKVASGQSDSQLKHSPVATIIKRQLLRSALLPRPALRQPQPAADGFSAGALGRLKGLSEVGGEGVFGGRTQAVWASPSDDGTVVLLLQDELLFSQTEGTSTPKADVAKPQEPQEIIKPVPITHTSASASPVSFSSTGGSGSGSGRGSPALSGTPAYNKTARPFGGGAPSSGISTPPRVASIPSASSAFTPTTTSSTSVAPTHSQQQQQQSIRAFPAPSSSSSASSSASSSPARSTSAGPSAPHSSVYNTPIQLYSSDNACEVAMGQRRGLLEAKGGVELFNGTAKKPVLTVEREVAQPPVAYSSDASKKRLMEDTEDWHPRTGTTQSRSFRILAQMTGTENNQAPENSSAKK
ncbi:hypothetical protein ACEWY4_016554 [Coilia grayii]|uniref:PDZ and LIM domain-containing protein n=1 Tax=Coilia grayii TaxID=363190 RepID=A0ABD1JNE4_9TELE